MAYNSTKLDGEFKKAGLKIHGVDSNGKISWDGEPTKEQKDLGEQVKAVHDNSPLPTPKEEFALLNGLEEKVDFIIKHLGLL